MSEEEIQRLLASQGTKTLSVSDFMHALGVGLQVLIAIQNVVAGQAGNITVSFKGKKYDVTVTPQ